MKSLGTTALFIIGGGFCGWSARSWTDHIRDFGEAEYMQQVVQDPAQIPASIRSHFGKLVLHDSNGDRVIIVNGTHQLRLIADKSRPVIEELGMQ